MFLLHRMEANPVHDITANFYGVLQSQEHHECKSYQQLNLVSFSKTKSHAKSLSTSDDVDKGLIVKTCNYYCYRVNFNSYTRYLLLG